MYHIVYLTTNLINNKFYIGVHSTYDLNDGYLGSGRALKSAIKKYGRTNFNRDIIYYCLDSVDAYQIESQIVNETFIMNKSNYNSCIGGKGGAKIMTDERRKNISLSKIGKPAWNKGKPMSDEQKKKLSNYKTGTKLSDETKLKVSLAGKGKPAWNKGIPHTDEHKANISKRLRNLK